MILFGISARALAVSFFFCSVPAHAHLSLLLHEAIGGAGETTSAGHAAVYLSNVCGDEFTGLRLCNAGEPGIVIASYPEFGMTQKFEWLAVPLPYYLYGMAAGADLPIYANGKVRTLLRTSFKQQFLAGTLSVPSDAAAPPKVRWNQMVGVVYNRDVYAFTVATTIDEDREFIATFNARPNESHFSTMYNNCADFAMGVVNTYFPKTLHRDYLNDFTMSTPKALARELTLGFARTHPERSLSIQKFSQVPGPIQRSFDNRNFSEQAFRSKKYFITQAILNQELLGIFVGSYYITAHFDPSAQFKRLGTRDLATLHSLDHLPSSPAVRSFMDSFTDSGVTAPVHSAIEKTFSNGTTWQKYRSEFKPMMERAMSDGYFLDHAEVATFFRDLERQSEPEEGPNGLRLRVHSQGAESILGITAENILAADSNRKLAYKLLLCVVRADLNSAEKNRNPLDQFQRTWSLLQAAAAENPETVPVALRRRFLETPVEVPFKKQVLKAFLLITH